MEISLTNFGTHLSATYSFEKGKIILLKGNSGEGKSTIFRALEWAFYGTNRKVETYGATASTYVKVKIGDIVIERKKKPNFLRLLYEGKDYENTIAQELINRLFGSHDLWKMSSYIPQGQRCQLLENKNIDNMDRLNELTFRGENPDEFYDKIDNKIREKTNIYRDIQSHNAFRKKALDKKMSQIQPTLKELQDPIELNDLIHKEEVLQEEYQQLQSQRLHNERLKGQWVTLNDRRKRLEEELSKFPIIEDVELEDLKRKIPIMKEDIDKIQRRHQLTKDIEKARQDIKSLESLLPGIEGKSSPYFSQEGYYQLLNLEKQYHDNEALAGQWNVSYSLEVIKEEIEKSHKEIEESLCLNEKHREWERNEELKSRMGDERNRLKKIQGELKKVEESLKDTQQVPEKFYTPEDMKVVKKEIDKLKELLKLIEIQEREEAELEKGKKEIKTLKIRENEILKASQERIVGDNDVEKCRQELNELLERERVLVLAQEALECPLCHGLVNLHNRTLVPLGECPQGNIGDIKKSLVKKKRELKDLEEFRKETLQRAEELKFIRKKVNELSERNNGQKNLDNSLPSRQEVQEELNNKKKEYAEMERQKIERDKMDNERKHLTKNLQLLLQQEKEKEELIKSLETQIKEDFPEPQRVKGKIPEMKKRVSELEKIVFVVLPKITSKEIKTLLTIEDIRMKMIEKELEDEKIMIVYDTPDLPEIYEETCREYEKKKKVAARQKVVREELEELKENLGKIILREGINEECQEKEKEIKNLQDLIIRRREIEDLNKLISEYRNMGEEEKKMENDLLKLNQLKTLINEVECQYIQKTVDLLNETLEDVAESLFTEPISLTLDLYKELKSTHRLKQAVNLKCIYKGIEYGKIEEMSGGEGDRVSLALIIALHKLSPSPLLLLDECISSLDSNLREQCLKSLREHLGEDKTAIAIIHETIEGHFDEVVKI